jgi:hypothetical protein
MRLILISTVLTERCTSASKTRPIESVYTHRQIQMKLKEDLSEKRFGRLVVLKRAKSIRRKDGALETHWFCLCDCGTKKLVNNKYIHKAKSCGCLRLEGLSKTYGMSSSSEYRSFTAAKSRCIYPTNIAYANYGGRGIRFLFTSFEQFFKEVGPKPKGTTLERKNNNGNYEPGNVCWATPREQAANKRTKRIDQFSTDELRAELKRREETNFN